MDLQTYIEQNFYSLFWGGIILFIFFVLILLRYFYQKVTVNEAIPKKDRVVLKIAVPRNNMKSPLAAEQLYASLHGIIQNMAKAVHLFSFEIVAGEYGVFFVVVTNRRFHRFVENQIYSQYPEAEIKEVKDYCENFEKMNKSFRVVELGQAKHFYLPIRTFNSFEVDPLASITGQLPS